MSNYPDWLEDRFGDDIPDWAEERWGDEDDDEQSLRNQALLLCSILTFEFYGFLVLVQ